MARKLIDSMSVLERTVKVYRDSEWQEYVVRLYVDGKLQPNADYFTNNKEDALSTGACMANG